MIVVPQSHESRLRHPLTVASGLLGPQAGTWLLAAATLLTLWSLVVYMRNAMKYML